MSFAMETRGIRFRGSVVAGLCALGFSSDARGAELFEAMTQSCASERTAYCRSAMPNDARIALCLYSHEHKLSAGCGVAVYDAMIALHVTLNTISDYMKKCRSDLMKLCATTQWGEGRLYGCLTENRDTLTSECRIALDGARPGLKKLGVLK